MSEAALPPLPSPRKTQVRRALSEILIVGEEKLCATLHAAQHGDNAEPAVGKDRGENEVGFEEETGASAQLFHGVLYDDAICDA